MNKIVENSRILANLLGLPDDSFAETSKDDLAMLTYGQILSTEINSVTLAKFYSLFYDRLNVVQLLTLFKQNYVNHPEICKVILRHVFSIICSETDTIDDAIWDSGAPIRRWNKLLYECNLVSDIHYRPLSKPQHDKFYAEYFWSYIDGVKESGCGLAIVFKCCQDAYSSHSNLKTDKKSSNEPEKLNDVIKEVVKRFGIKSKDARTALKELDSHFTGDQLNQL